MDTETKRNYIKTYCENRKACDDQFGEVPCPLKDTTGDQCYITDDLELLNKNYDILFGVDEETTEEVTDQPVNDMVKHPSHYCREGAMECIDEMVLLFGKEAVKNYCLLNIWKYRYRSADKNGKQDIEKSDQYVRIYKELTDERPETI